MTKLIRKVLCVLFVLIPMLAHAYTPEEYEAAQAGRGTPEVYAALIAEYSALGPDGYGKAASFSYKSMQAQETLYRETQDKIAALQRDGQAVDWEGIASSLGMPPGLSAAEINLRLAQSRELASNWLKDMERKADDRGVGVDQYLLDNFWAQDKEPNPDGPGYIYKDNKQTYTDVIQPGYDQSLVDIDYIKKAPPMVRTPKDKAGNTGVDVNNFLNQIRKQLPQFIRFIVALSYVCGIFLMIAGIMKLKAYGQQTVMSSSHATFAGPLTYLSVGAALTFFPSMLNVGTATFMGLGGGDAIYAYNGASAGLGFAGLTMILVGIVKVVGFIAFFKGWMILSKIGSHNAQQGVVGKGVVHIAAGILAVNIMATWEILRATFGYMW